MKELIIILLIVFSSTITLANITEKQPENSNYIMPTWVFSPKYKMADSRYQNSKESAKNFFNNTSNEYVKQKNYQKNDLNRRMKQNTNKKTNTHSNNDYKQ